MTCTHRAALTLATFATAAAVLSGCGSASDESESRTPTSTQFTPEDRAFLTNLDDSFATMNPVTLTTVGVQVCKMLRDGKAVEEAMNMVAGVIQGPGHVVDFVHAAKTSYCPSPPTR
jgi:hypothetical protein